MVTPRFQFNFQEIVSNFDWPEYDTTPRVCCQPFICAGFILFWISFQKWINFSEVLRHIFNYRPIRFLWFLLPQKFVEFLMLWRSCESYHNCLRESIQSMNQFPNTRHLFIVFSVTTSFTTSESGVACFVSLFKSPCTFIFSPASDCPCMENL
jgi:hypothetical protein